MYTNVYNWSKYLSCLYTIAVDNVWRQRNIFLFYHNEIAHDINLVRACGWHVYSQRITTSERGRLRRGAVFRHGVPRVRECREGFALIRLKNVSGLRATRCTSFLAENRVLERHCGRTRGDGVLLQACFRGKSFRLSVPTDYSNEQQMCVFSYQLVGPLGTIVALEIPTEQKHFKNFNTCWLL